MNIISRTEIVQLGDCFIETETKISSAYEYNIGLITPIEFGMSYSEIETELSTNIYVTASYLSGSLFSINSPLYNMYFRPNDTNKFNHIYLNTIDSYSAVDYNSPLFSYDGSPAIIYTQITRLDKNPTADGVVDVNVDWGDGGTDVFQFKMYIGEISVFSLSHVFNELGPQTITVSVEDSTYIVNIEVRDPELYALIDAYDNIILDATNKILLDSYDD